MQIEDTVSTYSVDRTEGPYEGESLSVHVVRTPTATVQFGAGDEHTADRVADVVADHDVSIVVAEHADPDHYRGIPGLREAFDFEVAVPEADAHVLVEEGIDVDHRLRPGERYWGIETIGVPGHSPGNMSYLYNDVLIAGDSVVGSDFERAADEHWSGRLAVLGPDSHHDAEAARDNVTVLLTYDFETVLVTHGSNVLTGGTAEVRTLVDDLGGN